MNIDQLRKQFPDEDACRSFFESILWKNGRICPRCFNEKSYYLKGASVRRGAFECSWYKRHFTIPTKTPMHSTKLPLWKWLLAMYLIVNSSEGISSVYLGKLIDISQKSAWKLGDAIRKMMDSGFKIVPALCGIIELNEKYIGGKPSYQKGVVHRRGRGTAKQ
jgi:transposase-like protein